MRPAPDHLRTSQGEHSVQSYYRVLSGAPTLKENPCNPRRWQFLGAEVADALRVAMVTDRCFLYAMDPAELENARLQFLHKATPDVWHALAAQHHAFITPEHQLKNIVRLIWIPALKPDTAALLGAVTVNQEWTEMTVAVAEQDAPMIHSGDPETPEQTRLPDDDISDTAATPPRSKRKPRAVKTKRSQGADSIAWFGSPCL